MDVVVRQEEDVDNGKKIEENDVVNEIEEFEENEDLICDWLEESV